MIVWKSAQELKARVVIATILMLMYAVFGGATEASAQASSSAQDLLAETAAPTTTLTDMYIRCLQGGGKEKTCSQLSMREAQRSSKNANETADAIVGAAQGTRPIVMGSSYGYGGSFAGAYSPGFIPGGGAPGVNIAYGGPTVSTPVRTSGSGGYNSPWVAGTAGNNQRTPASTERNCIGSCGR